MLVTTKQKMYLTMHGLVDKGETIDIPEDVINDFGKDCFEFVGEVTPKGNETEPGDKKPSDENTGDENPPDENTGDEKPKKTSKKKTDTTEE
jgi:hypothetical protein|nr:MAG TPA: hypothetical protein [Caudoviricetes sp.]